MQQIQSPKLKMVLKVKSTKLLESGKRGAPFLKDCRVEGKNC